ncbi:MAG TPA: hypothetical protein VET89_07615, partial [Stellaceae bacterium]|nr:hypothetical protein [Stellaceae bacterium]
MSANSPGSALEDAPAPQITALSAVFRRLGSKAPAPIAPPPPVDAPPKILGFGDPPEVSAEPVPRRAPASGPAVPTGEGIATPAPVTAKPLAALHADRELERAAEPSAPSRGQDLVGRLSRRLGKAVEASGSSNPATEPPSRPSPRSAAALHALAPALSARPAMAPAAKAVAPSHTPALDRAGREHLSHNRRLHRRVRLSAEMEVDGVPCSLIDVSV